MSYPHGPNIRSRSISEIAAGRLHHYGIEQIPRNPYATGSLRHLFRTSSISRRDSPAELHLKTAGEIEDEIKTLEQRVERAKKELQRKKDLKKDDLETGGAEIGPD